MPYAVDADAQVVLQPQQADASGQFGTQRQIVPRKVVIAAVAPGGASVALQTAGAEIDHRAESAQRPVALAAAQLQADARSQIGEQAGLLP